MKIIPAALFIFFSMVMSATAQNSLKLTTCTKIPTAIKSCGGLYASEKALLSKQQYIFAADFQNKAVIGINGRQILLQLKNSETVGKNNFNTYEGGGFLVILVYHTTQHTGHYDLEAGTLEVIRGKQKIKINIHGRSSCDI